MSTRQKKPWTPERLSQTVLYAIVGASAVLFALFYLVGFRRIDDVSANFNAPLFTDVLLVFMWLLVVTTLVLVGWSRMKSVRRRDGDSDPRFRRLRNRLALGLGAVCLVLPLLASKAPMMVNGQLYDNGWWLKTSEVVIDLSLLMLIMAAGAILYGYMHSYLLRKEP